MSQCGGHGHGGCDGGHSHEPAEAGVSYSLYQKIDLENVQCLNEAVENSGRQVFKPWEDRLSTDKFVESDVDEELLYNIPFTDQIKLKGILIIGGENGHHPNKMRLFKNRPYMTFEDVRGKADQEFELHPDPSGTIEYPTNPPEVAALTWPGGLRVPRNQWAVPSGISVPGRVTQDGEATGEAPDKYNFGEEITKIFYIGFRGEFTKAHRHGVTICNYEMSPQMSDHKDKVLDQMGRPVS